MIFENVLVSKDEFVIRPVHDFGFKVLFGHSSDSECVLLRSFLEALFDKKFEIVEFRDRQITPAQALGKEVRLDLRCMCDGEECNLEMQMALTGSEGERLLYYLAQSIGDMEMKGKSYHQLSHIRQVFILAADTELAEFGVNEFLFQNSVSHTILTDKVKAYMINLVKVLASITDYQKMTLLQKWAVFLLYGHLSDHEGVNVLMKDEVFRKAADIMRIINDDEELKDMAFARMKREMDQITRLENAERRGFEQGTEQGIELGIEQGIELGIEQGIEQGVKSARIEVILRLYEMNMDLDVISEATNMPKDEVKDVIREYQKGTSL